MKWALFLKLRKAVYAVISLTALVLAIILSVYLAHAWRFLNSWERGTLLGIIAADTFTAVLVYLMIVVYFRWGLDFARALSLCLLHIGVSIALILTKRTFPCTSFMTQASCDSTYAGFTFTSISVAALLVIYTLGLLVMLRVPLPPIAKPDLLPDDPEMRKRESVSSTESIDSTKGLLRPERSRSTMGVGLPVSPRRTYRVANQATSIVRPPTRPAKLRKQGPIPDPLPLHNPFHGPHPNEYGELKTPALATADVILNNSIEKWMPAETAYTPRRSPPRAISPDTPPPPMASRLSPPAYANSITQSPTGVVLSYRNPQTTGPHSARSVAPSMYMVREPPLSALPEVYAARDTMPRPHTTSPAPAMPMTAGATVRRFGTDAAYHASQRNSGIVPPRSATQPVSALGAQVQHQEWRQLVMKAASGETY